MVARLVKLAPPETDVVVFFASHDSFSYIYRPFPQVLEGANWLLLAFVSEIPLASKPAAFLIPPFVYNSKWHFQFVGDGCVEFDWRYSPL